jgi:uncharacterized protein (DUF362 family)
MRFPRFVEVEQGLYARRADDIPAAVARACADAGLTRRVRPGHRVGITVGSRGIAGIAEITRAVVAVLKQQGARPFVLPAMGSHGGATAAGQTAVLASLGVTPQSVGAPIRAAMAVARLGQTTHGLDVYVSREALRADGVIVMNRIKQHTDFGGEYESGLMKMLAIGLGKRKGAAAMHARRCASLREDVPEAARMMLDRAPIIAGLAILENGYNEPAEIVGLAARDIPTREPALIQRVRRNAARLPFRAIDLLILDRIGKDVSGIGMDTHVVCRRMIWDEPEFRGADIQLIAALDLTEASHGNALGVGIADLITERLLRKVDMEALKTNVLHTGWLNRAKIPLAFADDRELLQAAFIALGHPDPRRVRIVRIQDTLHLGRLWVSEGLLPEARRHPRVRVQGKLSEVGFDRRGTFRWPAPLAAGH